MIHIFSNFILGFTHEINSEFYRILGVKHFKKIVPFGDYWIRLFNLIFSTKLRILNTKENAIIWVSFTIGVELLHIIGFIIMIWLAVQHSVNEDYFRLIKLSTINIIVNIYPIFVQRYNRLRIIRIYNLSLKNMKDFKL